MSSFMNPLYSVIARCFNWILSVCVLIRTNPFLLFTVGFVAIGYVISVLGRMLSND